jgi:hypothetical protein
MKTVLCMFAALMAGSIVARAVEPQLRSWFTIDSAKPAHIYRTDADKHLNRTATTWSNGRNIQSTPVNCGVQAVMSSDDWVYVRSTGLGSQVMGPWYIDSMHYRLFPNLPTDQHMIFRLPRHPVVAETLSRTSLGEIGMFVDGVSMFDSNDAFSYSNKNGRDGDPRAGVGHGDHIWNRDAFVNEGITFDAALGHQQNWGRYHYHGEPLALRYLLGDQVDFDASTKTYHESAAVPFHHSPIIGWMRDGFPIYGPYGYSSPSNSASGVRRMVSGYVLRDDLAQNGRHTLPAWAARERRCSVNLTTSQSGPNVSPRYPAGHYIEDHDYLGDLGKLLGRDFDLDEFNGRWCVTPEFPHGTYAYFTAIDASGAPVYPYNMGRRYRGVPSGHLVDSINELVETNFSVGASAAASVTGRPKTVTLVWQSDSEGGAYQPNAK